MKQNAGVIMTLVFLGVLLFALGAMLVRKLMWALHDRRLRTPPPPTPRPGPPLRSGDP